MDNKKDKHSEISGTAFGIQKIEIDLNSFDGDPDLDHLPILPTRNLVLFPGMTVTFELGRESAKYLAKHANENKMAIGVDVVLSLRGSYWVTVGELFQIFLL